MLLPQRRMCLRLQNLKRLDYWAIQRNHLIHSSPGVSKQRMWELWRSRNRDADACQPNHIQSVMSQILENGFQIVISILRLRIGQLSSYWVGNKVYYSGLTQGHHLWRQR
ncbi:hypothetical protein [Coleofasciculus sp. F4-SAH-05]|uniref:hypothetical protein n=1 Tax=Coleofasciculus sp. F4-SAH-05 TaxID=3069525 RepID=UPI0032F85912